MSRLAAAVVLFGGCAEAPGSHEAAIVGGFEPTDADATVAVGYSVPGSDFSIQCSGTLVAPNVVLTAKHCIPRPDECRVGGGFAVGFGPDGRDRIVPVARAICAPSSCGDACPPDWNYPNEDIALAILEEDVDDVPPREVPRDGDDLHEGDVLRLVGYGNTEAFTSGHRLETDDTVASFGGYEIVTEGNGVCLGDSGGSAIDDAGRVVGVIVRMAADSCALPPPTRIAWLTRVSAWTDLVDEAMAEAAPEEDAGVEDAGAEEDAGSDASPREGRSAAGCSVVSARKMPVACCLSPVPCALLLRFQTNRRPGTGNRRQATGK